MSPADVVGPADGTPLGQFLRRVGARVEDGVAEPVSPAPRELFLSVVLRTTGRGPQHLREVLLCLAAQSDPNFEVLLAVHDATAEGREDVARVLADQPQHLRGRTTVLDRGDVSATGALNAGLREARGRYLVGLDDDALVLGGWVASFHEHEDAHAGRILRVQCVTQAVADESVRGLAVVRGRASPEPVLSPDFSLLEHLTVRSTPIHGWALPLSPGPLHLAYDEASLAPVEELLVRAAELVGVHDIPAVTAVRHRPPGASDATEDDLDLRTDDQPLLLGAAETRRVSAVMREWGSLRLLRERTPQLETELELTHQHAENLALVVASLRAELERTQRKARRVEEKLRKRLAKLERPRDDGAAGSPAATPDPPSGPAGKVGSRLRRLTGR